LFPDLRRELTRRGYSVYSLFFDLKPLLREAFDCGDTDPLLQEPPRLA